MRANWGIGVVPPHLMPKPVVVREKRCGTCRWYDGPKHKEDGGLCRVSLDGTSYENFDGKVLVRTGPNNPCPFDGKWEAR